MIRLHNTLSKKTEEFTPLEANKVKMYHCGPTVYWTQHIGNMRAVVIVDFVRRTFMAHGYDVTLVRNYTDVGHLTGDNIGDADTGEDRMEKAAKREQSTPDEIAQKYIDIYNHDITLLNTISPTFAPRATEYIDDMISMVQKLLENGCAYATDYAIYFSVPSFPDYTQLSGQKLEKLESGEGHGAVSDPNKRDPHDFALWFFKAGAHANALQTWKSPFTSALVENGQGFPGWHIECSAMSKHFLGNTFDIHMGGVEHIPIHHTNEIAQSTCANHTTLANYWLHNEHLLVDGKKMSKSEGTSFLVQDIIDRGFNPIALRYFFLQAHYRSKQNFTWEALEAGNTAYKKMKNFVDGIAESGIINTSYHEKFLSALADDINTSAALAIAWELIKDNDISNEDKKATLLVMDAVLGLKLDETTIADEIPEEVKKLADEREQARNNKDWSASDTLRDQIAELGFEVLDTANGQKIKKS